MRMTTSHIFCGGNSIVAAIEIGSGADLSVGVVRCVRGAENEFMADIVFLLLLLIYIYFYLFPFHLASIYFPLSAPHLARYKIYTFIYFFFFIIIVFVVVIVFWSIASHKNEMPATLTQPLAMACCCCCCLAHAFLRLRCWLIFMATFFDG